MVELEQINSGVETHQILDPDTLTTRLIVHIHQQKCACQSFSHAIARRVPANRLEYAQQMLTRMVPAAQRGRLQ